MDSALRQETKVGQTGRLLKEQYSDHYRTDGAASRYAQKFQDRIEHLRHVREANLLRLLATGKVLDLSIATGRFIKELERARWIVGVDYSEEFLRWSAALFPDVPLVRCDLLQGIPINDRSFDFVFCFRTLSSLGDVTHIISDMYRVCRPGGTIVFDYGRSAKNILIKGRPFTTDASDIESILSTLDIECVERIAFDGILLWLKRSAFRKKLFNRTLGRILGNRALLAVEEKSTRWLHDRIVYVVKRSALC